MRADPAGLLLLLLRLAHVSGGICWASMKRNGHCADLLAEKVTREQCCSTAQPLATGWSADDLDTSALFLWKVMGEGVPCEGCRESCSGVQCDEGRRCSMRRGRPRCVCAPRCGGGGGGGGGAGPVCGSDGRSYRSLCRLRKRACRRRAALALDYRGACQDSCARVRCGAGRHCLVDQDERAHCVRCSRVCPRAPPPPAQPLCGADGRTYASPCHLRAAACRAGRSIPLNYRGPCNRTASCETITCKERQVCLSDPVTGTPRCVTCGAKCPRSPRPRRALCASNNHTYASWCHMVRDACATGFIIDTKHPGACGTIKLNHLDVVHHGDDKEDDDFNISI